MAQIVEPPISPLVAPLEDISRRGLLVAPLAAGLFAACRGDERERAAAPPAATDVAERVVRHALGEARVPASPRRVLALGEDGLLVDLIEIGIKPVASIVNLPDRVPLLTSEELAGVRLFRSTAETSLEEFLALRPDLIIGTRYFIEQAGYEALSRVAPTVAVEGDDPLDLYVQTLAVFGKDDIARADVDRFTARVQAERQRLGAEGRRVSVATIYPGPSVAAWVDGPSATPRLLQALGVRLSPDASEVSGLEVRSGRVFLSLERLNLFTGEALILLQSVAVEGEDEAVDALKANPLWASLRAVWGHQVVTLDRLGYPGFRGYRALLDALIAALS